MKRILFIVFTLLSLSFLFAGNDIIISVTIPFANIGRITEMMDSEYPKQSGETTLQQGKRMIKTLIVDKLSDYERRKNSNTVQQQQVIYQQNINDMWSSFPTIPPDVIQ